MSIGLTEENIIKEVASRFRTERLRLEMSQDDVAKVCGVSSRSVISWESGVKIPSHHLAQLARCDFDVGFVLTGVLTANAHTQQYSTVDMKAAKMAELLNGLNEDQQRDIFAIIEEKKRLNELEEIVFQMQRKLG